MLISLIQSALQIVEGATAATLKAETGLTARQLAVLKAIEAMTAGNAKPNQAQLITGSGMDRSTLSEVIRRLVRRDLVIRTTSKADARAKHVKLTGSGRIALQTGLDIVGPSDLDIITQYRLATTVKSLESFVRQHAAASTVPPPTLEIPVPVAVPAIAAAAVEKTAGTKGKAQATAKFKPKPRALEKA